MGTWRFAIVLSALRMSQFSTIKRVLKYTLNHSETHCFIFGIFISGYFSLHFFT